MKTLILLSLFYLVLIEHILKNGIDKKGIQLPFNKDIYNPILNKLKKLGIGFKEIEINI